MVGSCAVGVDSWPGKAEKEVGDGVGRTFLVPQRVRVGEK